MERKAREDLLGKIIGNYRILEFIAEGGFGRTYKAEHTRLGTPVCIKHGSISKEDAQIMIEEAKNLWDLRHYGIPAIKDVLTLDDKTIAIVMSYIPGITLEKIIKKSKSLDPEDVAWITERSLNVLKYLHYNGVVHGDVKPQNIILQPDIHNLALVDYGFSSLRTKGNDMSKGYTPYFSSPEQTEGKNILPESDIYGLGMTMLYCLGGDVTRKEFPEDVPKEFASFLKKMIVRDVLSRINWEEGDLVEKVQEIRRAAFGRKHSLMKSLKGWENYKTENLKGGVG